MEQLRELILRRFPDEITIGEEDQSSPEQMRRILSEKERHQWTVDGLDGTGNRSIRTNSYGAMISRRKGNDILFAAIFRPADEKLRGDGFFWAARGKKAWQWCGEHGTYHQLRTADHGKLERLLVMLEGSSKKFFRPPISNLGLAVTTRPSLSTSIATTTVAQGRATALVTIENKPWDNWPAACFIKEAGGVVTDWQGNSFKPENCGSIIAAANAKDHAYIVQILNRRRN